MGKILLKPSLSQFPNIFYEQFVFSLQIIWEDDNIENSGIVGIEVCLEI